MRILKSLHRKKEYSEKEIVIGLQMKDKTIECWFFDKCRNYFMNSFNKIFFDQDLKEEIFQDSFIKLWTQIENKRICVKEGMVCRINKSGQCVPLTCSLTTFLMAIAKNDYREVVRNTKEIYVPEYFDDEIYSVMPTGLDVSSDDVKTQMVDHCLMQMSPRCIEILTMFYIQGMSLDEILSVRKENSSKIGLKSAKYKCMNTLRDKVTKLFNALQID